MNFHLHFSLSYDLLFYFLYLNFLNTLSFFLQQSREELDFLALKKTFVLERLHFIYFDKNLEKEKLLSSIEGNTNFKYTVNTRSCDIELNINKGEKRRNVLVNKLAFLLIKDTCVDERTKDVAALHDISERYVLVKFKTNSISFNCRSCELNYVHFYFMQC